ncbi:MAG: hypothetical protein K2P81_11705 [Bacteriovoracaceae bacterium]|nr:hypothetical protein [Bacteriovoracaceae bacterium]
MIITLLKFAFLVILTNSAFASETIFLSVTSKDKLTAQMTTLYHDDLFLRPGQKVRTQIPSWVGQANSQKLFYEISFVKRTPPSAIETIISTIITDNAGSNPRVIANRSLKFILRPREMKRGRITINQGGVRLDNEFSIENK